MNEGDFYYKGTEPVAEGYYRWDTISWVEVNYAGNAVDTTNFAKLNETNTFAARNNHNAGIGFQSAVASSPQDLTRHIGLYGTVFGFSVTSGTLNYVVPASNMHKFYAGTSAVATFTADKLRFGTYGSDAWDSSIGMSGSSLFIVGKGTNPNRQLDLFDNVNVTGNLKITGRLEGYKAKSSYPGDGITDMNQLTTAGNYQVNGSGQNNMPGVYNKNGFIRVTVGTAANEVTQEFISRGQTSIPEYAMRQRDTNGNWSPWKTFN